MVRRLISLLLFLLILLSFFTGCGKPIKYSFEKGQEFSYDLSLSHILRKAPSKEVTSITGEIVGLVKEVDPNGNARINFKGSGERLQTSLGKDISKDIFEFDINIALSPQGKIFEISGLSGTSEEVNKEEIKTFFEKVFIQFPSKISVGKSWEKKFFNGGDIITEKKIKYRYVSNETIKGISCLKIEISGDIKQFTKSKVKTGVYGAVQGCAFLDIRDRKIVKIEWQEEQKDDINIVENKIRLELKQ